MDVETDESVAIGKIPWYMKLYGGLCLFQAVLALLAVVVIVVLVAVALLVGGGSELIGALGIDLAEVSTMTIVLVALSALVSLATAVALLVFGLALLRNRRRNAAHGSHVLIVLTVASLLLAIMLEGIGGVDMVRSLVQLVILIAISVTVDPSLAEERRLRRTLRNMELRDEAEAGTLGRDKTGRGYVRLDFFNLFWTFVVCCVIGLIIEDVYHFTVSEPGVYQNRAGMLIGPFCPVYGFGAVLMTLALNHIHNKSLVLIFIVSAVVGAAFEAFMGWFMQVSFGATVWDYTGYTIFGLPDPLVEISGGRTGTKYALMWGVLGIVWIKWLLPGMLKVINLIPWRWRYVVTTVCALLMLADGIMSLQALDCWFERTAGVVPTTPIERFYAEYFDDEYMQATFESASIDVEQAARIPRVTSTDG